MRWISGVALAALVCLPAIPDAQAPPTSAAPRFEVASVRPNNSGEPRSRMGVQVGGRFVATNVTLEQVIVQAYQIQPFQLAGAPAWVKSDRFDIVATAGADVPEPTPWVTGPVPGMIQALLADRFKLAVRREPRQMAIYALVPARSDGRLGPALQRSTIDCASLAAAARIPGEPAMPPPLANGRPVCGNRLNNGRIAGGGMPVSIIALALQSVATSGRPVIDRTGLSGLFDFDLTYAPAPPPSPDAPLPDSTGASIFTALQEQLGLKLEPQQGAVDVVVVERVEHPTAD